MSGRLRMIHLHADVDTADDVTVEIYAAETPDHAQRVVLTLFGGRGGDVDTISVRLTPALAEVLAAGLTEGAREARAAVLIDGPAVPQ